MKIQFGRNPSFPIDPLAATTTPADFSEGTALPFLEEALSFGNAHDLLVLNPHPFLSASLPHQEDRHRFNVDFP